MLLSRPSPRTLPLGGGTQLSRPSGSAIEVVDLQSLGLSHVRQRGDRLELGASVTLQQLLFNPDCPAALQSALTLEAPLNLRTTGTVAGALVVATGRSTFATVLMAVDAKITCASVTASARKVSLRSSASKKATASRPTIETQSMGVGDLVAAREQMEGTLITHIDIPLNVQVAFDFVSRTPADTPIVSVALARWPSGRTRMAVGGFGHFPALAMDGTEAAGLEAAARNATHDSTDEWANAEYRMQAAQVLASRCLQSFGTSA